MADDPQTPDPECPDCAHAGCPTLGKCREIERLRECLRSVRQSLKDLAAETLRGDTDPIADHIAQVLGDQHE